MNTLTVILLLSMGFITGFLCGAIVMSRHATKTLIQLTEGLKTSKKVLAEVTEDLYQQGAIDLQTKITFNEKLKSIRCLK